MAKIPEQIRDELLVLQCQQGNGHAFTELVNRWQDRLLRHACRLTRDGHVALDIVQETWIAIIKGLPHLDDAAAFPTWAFRIMTNKCSDWIRKQQRRRRLEKQLARATMNSGSAAPGTTGGSDSLKQAMDALPRDQRAAVALHYLEGFMLAEIAEIESVPEGTIKSRLYHARNFLRRFMEGTDNGRHKR